MKVLEKSEIKVIHGKSGRILIYFPYNFELIEGIKPILRHSFTTQLLESDVDLRYIQEILGHKSNKTTEIYTHLSNRDLGKIKSQLDCILNPEVEEKE